MLKFRLYITLEQLKTMINVETIEEIKTKLIECYEIAQNVDEIDEYQRFKALAYAQEYYSSIYN